MSFKADYFFFFCRSIWVCLDICIRGVKIKRARIKDTHKGVLIVLDVKVHC